MRANRRRDGASRAPEPPGATDCVAALSTDGDNVPGCNGNQNVVPPLPLTEDSSYIVHVTPDRAASLGSAEAWNDCFLDPAEIAANPNAEAWVTAFRVYRWWDASRYK